jgi:hypothetical protein
LELGRNKQNFTVATAKKGWRLVLEILNGGEFLQTRSDVEVALQDTEAY